LVKGFLFGKSEGYYDEPQIKQSLKLLILPVVFRTFVIIVIDITKSYSINI